MRRTPEPYLQPAFRQNNHRRLKAHYADAEYAEETLYLVLQYFGWERHVFRYGPFSLDPDVIRLTARIRDTFATSKRFPLGAFCFFRTEQRALGESVIEQVATEAGVTQETMLFFSFRDAWSMRCSPKRRPSETL